jgi:hypothetical protein
MSKKEYTLKEFSEWLVDLKADDTHRCVGLELVKEFKEEKEPRFLIETHADYGEYWIKDTHVNRVLIRISYRVTSSYDISPVQIITKICKELNGGGYKNP